MAGVGVGVGVGVRVVALKIGHIIYSNLNMSSGTGTSFEQAYNVTSGEILPSPYPSNIGGNPALYENGGSSVSVNYAPRLGVLGGGGRVRGRGKGKSTTKRRKCGGKSKKYRRKSARCGGK
jgi:hypothetical protein